MTDEIIEELWRVKDDLAKEFHYDMDALAEELKRRQKMPGKKVVNLAKQKTPEKTQAESTTQQ